MPIPQRQVISLYAGGHCFRASVEREQGANACWRPEDDFPACCARTSAAGNKPMKGHLRISLGQQGENRPLFLRSRADPLTHQPRTARKESPTFFALEGGSTHDLIFTSANPSAPFLTLFSLSHQQAIRPHSASPGLQELRRASSNVPG